MKTYKKLSLFAALIAPLFASAQLITITGPNTTAVAPSGSSFHDLIIAMSNDAGALFTAEGDSLSIQSPINFLPTGFPVTGGDWESGTRANAINFYEVDITPFFRLTGTMEIGFIGEESGDPNSLEVTAYDQTVAPGTVQGPITLYDYNSPGFETAPRSHQISLDPNASVAYIQFTHTNTNVAFPPQTQPQDVEKRFRVWQAADVNPDTQELNYRSEYLFAIGDRNRDFDKDYDDGFFYLSGSITAVPEPSQIAALAMLGLAGALFIRRRFRK